MLPSCFMPKGQGCSHSTKLPCGGVSAREPTCSGRWCNWGGAPLLFLTAVTFSSSEESQIPIYRWLNHLPMADPFTDGWSEGVFGRSHNLNPGCSALMGSTLATSPWHLPIKGKLLLIVSCKLIGSQVGFSLHQNNHCNPCVQIYSRPGKPLVYSYPNVLLDRSRHQRLARAVRQNPGQKLTIMNGYRP